MSGFPIARVTGVRFAGGIAFVRGTDGAGGDAVVEMPERVVRERLQAHLGWSRVDDVVDVAAIGAAADIGAWLADPGPVVRRRRPRNVWERRRAALKDRWLAFPPPGLTAEGRAEELWRIETEREYLDLMEQENES